ncbi:MAG: tetratricopeptide repeat protein [Rickettsiales bacterium]|nr:tetratricopeptide repeat protein [Rickettsiales bacterium]
MFKIFKKAIIGKSEDKDKAQTIENKVSIVQKMQDKARNFTNFLKTKIQETKDEFGDIKTKVSKLLETNYNLGLKHLEKGNISDAIFRFRFIKKFWPEHFDAYYQLAYSLSLNKRPFEAKKILTELLVKKPDYDLKAQDLLDKINRGEI